MTAPGSDTWFSTALSGSDGTADPVVRHRPDFVWADPMADVPIKSALAPNDVIVLPPIHLAMIRSQAERLLTLEGHPPPPRAPHPPRGNPPPPPRAPAQNALYGPPPVAPQQRPGPPPAPAPRSPWTSGSLPAPLNNFLSGLQQQYAPPANRPNRATPPPARPTPARKNTASSVFIFLVVIGFILLVSGAGEQLVDLISDLFKR